MHELVAMLPDRKPGDASVDLEAFIPGDRRIALAAGASIPDRVHGAGLFADISGFTALTEALTNELGPQHGAEELTGSLNRVFHALIGELERIGGHVIYFSGDGITCWIDGDDGSRATTCALAMQAMMARVGNVETPSGAGVRLAMKVVVATGSARRFIVGDPAIQRIDVLAGRLVDALAMGERLAERGEVLVDPSVVDALGDRVEITKCRTANDSGRVFGVVRSVRQCVADAPVEVNREPLRDDVVRQWLQPAVYERLRTGRLEFLAELRPAYPLFVRFGGIDYDNDEAAIGKLDDFVQKVQRTLRTFGGNLLHLTLGDKGAYLSAVFGPPLSHEDDAERAAAAALALRDLASTTAVDSIHIGITYGRLRSGSYGHPRRQTFTCLGDAVNLAARLMSKAPQGAIYVSEPIRRRAGNDFTWEALAAMPLWGKAEKVPIFELKGSKRRIAAGRDEGQFELIGRREEIDVMASKLDDALAGRGRIVGISAEAGMGKSRLVAEFVRLAEQRGVLVAVGECQSYGAHSSYFVWRPVWSSLFNLDDIAAPDDRTAALENQLNAIDAELLPRMPLLRDVLDLSISDSSLTASFDPKLRKTSLEDLLVTCLRAKAGQQPLVLVLEDCHWIDALSRDLLEVLGRAVASLGVVIVLAYRPAENVVGGLGIESLTHFQELALTELDGPQAAQLIRSKLEQILKADTPPPASLVDLVTARAQGNPFYIEELINFIVSQNVSLQDEAALQRLELPESLHSLILSRIDALNETPRETLKLASVLGRTFRAAMLTGAYPELGTFDDINRHLAMLCGCDLVRSDQQVEHTYLFKHVMTQEVAYESLPFAFRAMLHERVGGYVEASEPDTIERNLDLLAHHYGRSVNLGKKREYFLRAGDAAQAAYANRAAIDYFERLAPLVEGRARVDVLLKLGKVHELVGNWQRAKEVDEEALSRAERLDDDHSIAACETALAEVARKQGRYEEALQLLRRARSRFQALGEESGVGRVLHLVGSVAGQRGDYATAIENYEASLSIRERLADKTSMAGLLSNLGIIAEYRGDYPASRAFHERALALRRELGDRWAIGISMNNLGMIAVHEKRHDAAREWFSNAMQLCREVGDGWMVAICHNNLGNAMRGLGDYASARRHYGDSLRAYRDYDDRWAISFLLEDVGVLAGLCGDPRSALELLGAADASRDAIGAPRSPSLEADIAKQIAVATATLSEEDRLAHRARGRSLDLASVIEHALDLCTTGSH